MTKDEKIKEVMELVINAVCAGIDYGKQAEAAPDKLKILHLKEDLVESKLRELIQ